MSIRKKAFLKSIKIREVERKLFNYLFLNKVALSYQIQRDIYPNISHQGLYKRLNRLIKAGYITANYHRELMGRLVYSLSQKSFDEFISDMPSKTIRVQLQSNSILHDLDLVDIRSRLKSSKVVECYYTENIIRSGIELIDKDLIEDFRHINFDAILKIKKHSSHHFTGIEYERTLKFATRYEDYFNKLYSHNSISAVLYICKCEKMMAKIQNFEKKVLKGKWPKVFYIRLEELLSNTAPTFKNLNNEKINLE